MLESFGFKVGAFSVGMGIVPEVNTTIVGSLNAVKVDELQELIDKNEDKKLLKACLGALITAKEFQQQADLLQFQQVTLEVKLGIPPKIGFDLQEAPEA